jgi:hypothetical protein
MTYLSALILKNILRHRRCTFVIKQNRFALSADQFMGYIRYSHSNCPPSPSVLLNHSVSETKNKLHPYYVTGFTDAEGNFTVGISKHATCKSGWNITTVFAIHVHQKDLALLKLIQSFFGVGNIVFNKTKGTVRFSVNSIKDIINVIIPHFMQYQLISQKRADFELFKLVAEMVYRKEHLTMEGLHKIVSIRASINNGLTENLKTAFPNVNSVVRPLVKPTEKSDPN